VLAVGSGLCVAFAAAGWPGKPNYCLLEGDCYCEAPRPGPIAQPANTWSLLGFGVAGLWVAWRSGRDHAVTRAPYLRSRFYPGLYASALAFMGPGAALFHASLTDWGGAVDILSMLGWICFLLYYNITALYDWSRSRFLTAYLVTIAIAITPRLFFGPAGVPLFSLLLLAWLASETLIGRPAGTLGIHHQVERRRRYLWASLVTNLLALFIWSGSHAGGWLCDPSSLLQGHAVWHVLNAVAGALLYPYLRSERIVSEHAVQQGATAARPQRAPLDLW
jgi:hypothetical protein